MSLSAVVYSPDGKVMDNQSIKADQAFDANTYQKIVHHGLMLHIDLERSRGEIS